MRSQMQNIMPHVIQSNTINGISHFVCIALRSCFIDNMILDAFSSIPQWINKCVFIFPKREKSSFYISVAVRLSKHFLIPPFTKVILSKPPGFCEDLFFSVPPCISLLLPSSPSTVLLFSLFGYTKPLIVLLNVLIKDDWHFYVYALPSL